MKDARHELIDYLALQFPATVGHIPLAEKIDEIRIQALLEAAEIANSDAIKVYGSQEYNMGVRAVHDAILARAKEVE